MVTEKIKEIAELKAKASKLEAKMIVERKAELASLAEKYGYDTLKAFIKAVKEAAGKSGKRPGPKPKGKGQAAGKPGKRKRAKITPAMREKVKAAVQAGKSGTAIAKQLGMSVQSVQNIKKSFGLVKSRAAAPAPAAV